MRKVIPRQDDMCVLSGIGSNYGEKKMKSKLSSKLGVTLIELLITVVIIGIVSSMAMPRFQSAWERIRVRSVNRDIVSTLRLARSMAITDKAPYGVYIDSDLRTITLFKDLVDAGVVLFEPGDSVVRVDTLPPEFTYLSTDMDNNVLVFRPNGSADFVGGGNIVAMANTETLTSIFQHNILASTGRVRSEGAYY
jgi:prepilin-type N-terminal cleavage/methylation domain-containing protein